MNYASDQYEKPYIYALKIGITGNVTCSKYINVMIIDDSDDDDADADHGDDGNYT